MKAGVLKMGTFKTPKVNRTKSSAEATKTRSEATRSKNLSQLFKMQCFNKCMFFLSFSLF